MPTRKYYSIQALASGPPEILLYETIGKDWWTGEGVDAREFVEDLKALGRVPEIVVRINCDGGNVFIANAMYNALKANSARKKVIIDGVALSAATIVAMAGDEIVMPENALMMVHMPEWWVSGRASAMRKTADDLDTVCETMIVSYQSKTGLPRDEIVSLLDAETWIVSAKAKELGFCDTVGQAVEFTAHYDLSRYKRVPRALLAGPNNSGGNRPLPGRSTPDPQQQEDPMDLSKLTAEELRQHRPDLVESITAQAKIDGEKAGMENERTRVKEITASCLPGQAPMAKKMIEDGTAIGDARKQFIEAAQKGGDPKAQQGRLDADHRTFQGVAGDGFADPWAEQHQEEDKSASVTARAKSIAAGFKQR